MCEGVVLGQGCCSGAHIMVASYRRLVLWLEASYRVWHCSLPGLDQLLVLGWRMVGMVGMSGELSMRSGMHAVHVLLVQVPYGRDSGHHSRLLETAAAHLELHGTVGIGAVHMRGQLAVAIWREFGHPGRVLHPSHSGHVMWMALLGMHAG